MTAHKVYISFDFEGIGGVCSFRETMGEVEWNRRATRQLAAFIDGIREFDSECMVTVSDSHAGGNNIVWDMLPDDVFLVRGFPRNDYMLTGLDKSFTHFVLFGYHSAAGGSGVMDHTYSSSSIYEIRLNGEIVDEGLINSYIASERGVPLSFVYGDDATAQFYESKFEEIDVLTSKSGVSRFSAVMKPESTLLHELKMKGEGLLSLDGVIFRPDLPLECEIAFTDTARTYLCSVIPGVHMTGGEKFSSLRTRWSSFTVIS